MGNWTEIKQQTTHQSKKLTMLGWLRFLRTPISFSTMSSCPLTVFFRMIFTATSLPVSRALAFLTVPYVPVPIVRVVANCELYLWVHLSLLNSSSLVCFWRVPSSTYRGRDQTHSASCARRKEAGDGGWRRGSSSWLNVRSCCRVGSLWWESEWSGMIRVAWGLRKNKEWKVSWPSDVKDKNN